MWKISLQNEVDFNALLRINKHIAHPELIYPGQTIFLPGQANIKQQLQTDYQKKMLLLINNERHKLNLSPLSFHPELSQIAEIKSKDMLIHKYVAHKSPTYGNPTDMLETFNVQVKSIQETVGAGPSTSQEMFETWLNSQENRRYILSKQATTIGVGCAKGGLHQYYWTLLIADNEKE